ncbi:hypothetical protein GQ53DRAFT_890521, partial [Thozetella sp. PMI_491]
LKPKGVGRRPIFFDSYGRLAGVDFTELASLPRTYSSREVKMATKSSGIWIKMLKDNWEAPKPYKIKTGGKRNCDRLQKVATKQPSKCMFNIMEKGPPDGAVVFGGEFCMDPQMICQATLSPSLATNANSHFRLVAENGPAIIQHEDHDHVLQVEEATLITAQ